METGPCDVMLSALAGPFAPDSAVHWVHGDTRTTFRPLRGLGRVPAGLGGSTSTQPQRCAGAREQLVSGIVELELGLGGDDQDGVPVTYSVACGFVQGMAPDSELLRYVPYNGGIGEAQLMWLKDTLVKAKRLDEKVANGHLAACGRH